MSAGTQTGPRHAIPLRAVPAPSDALEDALGELAPVVHSWLRRDLGPDSDIDDVFQDSMTALAQAIPKFRGQSSLHTYAYRITMRIAGRHRKRQRRRQANLELLPPSPESIDPESHAISRAALSRLYRALEKLKERRRRAFILCCIEGLPASDAAAREGIKADAMRSRLRHARRDLARRLSHDTYLKQLMGVLHDA